jgi:hypothetical protein
MGDVAQAIAQVLRENGGELAAIEIHVAVERVLDGPVHPSTVKNCLARSAARGDGRFRRASRGRYRLASSDGS